MMDRDSRNCKRRDRRRKNRPKQGLLWPDMRPCLRPAAGGNYIVPPPSSKMDLRTWRDL